MSDQYVNQGLGPKRSASQEGYQLDFMSASWWSSLAAEVVANQRSDVAKAHVTLWGTQECHDTAVAAQNQLSESEPQQY